MLGKGQQQRGGFQALITFVILRAKHSNYLKTLRPLKYFLQGNNVQKNLLAHKPKGELHFALRLLFHITKMTFTVHMRQVYGREY